MKSISGKSQPRPTSCFRGAGLLVALVTLSLTGVAAAGPDPFRTSSENLEMQVLSDGQQELGALTGRAMQVDIVLRNLGDKAVRVWPEALQTSLWFGSGLVGGGGTTAVPLESALRPIEPGGQLILKRRIIPRRAGQATLQVSLFMPQSRHVLRRGRKVQQEDLWAGNLGLSLPVAVRALTSERILDDPQVRKLLEPGPSVVEQLAMLDDYVGRERSENVVVVLSRLLDMSRPLALRVGAIHHLAVATRQGYGAAGLEKLLEVAGSEDRSTGERVLAVSALAVTQNSELVSHEGDNHIRVPVPDGQRKAVKGLLERLTSAEESPLQVAAAAALEGR